MRQCVGLCVRVGEKLVAARRGTGGVSNAGLAALLACIAFTASVWAGDTYQVVVGPYGPNPPEPWNREACLAANDVFYSTPQAACDATKSVYPLCDRNNAIYRNYVATLANGGATCHVTWEYQNAGSSGWYGWSSNSAISVCPEGWKRRLAPATGCVPVKDIPVELPQDACKAPMVGHPIFPLTGAKRKFVATGIMLGGIELTLTYDTTPKLRSTEISVVEPASFGALWRSSFHRKLQVAGANASAILSGGNGSLIYFEGGGGGFAVSGTVPHRLSIVSGGYLFSNAVSGTLEMFDTSGRLLTLTTPGGMVLTFSYGASGSLGSVVSSDGRSVLFAYGNGLISAVTAPDWGTITPAYDGQANLTGLTWPDGKTLGYLYENAAVPWAMTGEIDENGSRYGNYGYDSAGRATSTQLAGGADTYSVGYGTPPTLISFLVWDALNDRWVRTWQWTAPDGTSLTLPNGTSSSLGAQIAGGMPALTSRDQPAGSGCAASTSRQTYDGNGNFLSRDDFNGQRTCYAYDSSNREVVRVEGLPNTVACSTVTPANGILPAGARKITTAWHPDWSMPEVITEALKQTTVVYHGRPDPFNGDAAATCSSAAVRADGKPVPVICKRVERALLASGAVDAATPARIERFTYDSAGRVLSRTDAKGNTTTYAYYPGTAFANTGFDTNMAKVSLLLHGNGPNGSTAILDASAFRRPISVFGNAGLSATQSKFGGTSLAFGSAGDYVSIPYSSDFSFGGGDFTIEAFIYKNGNNANGSRIWNPNGDYYDGVNLGIDGNGNFSVYASTSGTSWTHSLPVVANLANGEWYHVALVRSGGSLFAFVNGTKYVVTTVLGGATLYADTTHERVIGGQAGANRALNGYVDEFRITKGFARYTTDFTPPSAEFPSTGPTIGAVGHTEGDLQSVTNAAGQATQFTSYDPAGRVRQMIDAKGVTTDVAYAPRGWIASTTVTPPLGSGRTTTYAHDNAGQLTAVSMPDGTSLTYSYDAAHRLIGITDARGNSIAYTLDNAGNRTAEEVRDMSGTLRRSVSRVFDALNRVQQVTGSER